MILKVTPDTRTKKTLRPRNQIVVKRQGCPWPPHPAKVNRKAETWLGGGIGSQGQCALQNGRKASLDGPIQVDVSVPAGQEFSNTIVVASNLLVAQQDMIRNGDTRVYIRAAQYNGTYAYTDIVQIWPHE